MKKVGLLLTLMMFAVVSFGQTFTGVSWVDTWADEPQYDDVTGYAENPYDNPEVTISQKDDLGPIEDVTSFDEVWDDDLEMEAHDIANPTDVPEGVDPYDLGDADTFGAQWKAYHDGSIVYVLLKFVDLDAQADGDSYSFEVMTQPTGYNETEGVFRHEPTFDQGVADEDMGKKNMAYARYVELGGGKAMFQDGTLSGDKFHASEGSSGNWVQNDVGKDAIEALLSDGKGFWKESNGVIRAVLPMDFDSDVSALSYPVDELEPFGDRTSLQIGEVFSFDVKANATIGGEKVQYFWSADANNGFASNYYSGHATLSSATNVAGQPASDEEGVTYADGVVYVEGQAADLEVFNLTGAKVLSAENVSSLSLSSLSKGVYIVRVNGQNSVKVVKR